MMVQAGVTVAITRTEHTAADLRRLAGQAGDAAMTRRLLALALVLDGHKCEDAARLAGMDWQALRDWVHATTRTAWRACPIGTAAAPSRACRPSRRPRLRGGCAPARTWPRTRSSVGGARTSRRGSRSCSASACTSAAWAACCAVCASPMSRRALSLPRRTSWRKRIPERVQRSCDRGLAPDRAGRGHAGRGLVPGRSSAGDARQGRPARDPDLRVGRDGQEAPRAATNGPTFLAPSAPNAAWAPPS